MITNYHYAKWPINDGEERVPKGQGKDIIGDYVPYKKRRRQGMACPHCGTFVTVTKTERECSFCHKEIEP